MGDINLEKDKYRTSETLKELKQLKMLCLIGAACSPLFSIFWFRSGQDFKNSILYSLAASLVLILIYLLTHIDGFVKNYPYQVLCSLIYLGNAVSVYSCYINGFSIESVLILVLVAFSLIWVFKASNHLTGSILIFIILILISLYLTKIPVINRPFFTYFLLMFFIISYVNARSRLVALNDLKDQEENYRNLVEISPQAIIVYQNGMIVYVNNAALKLLGAADVSDLSGKTIIDYVHPDNKEEMENLLEKVSKSGKADPVELKLFHMDGQILDADVSALRTNHGKRPAILFVMNDTTHLKKAQEQIRYMAFYDALTGMPNRHLLNSHLNEALVNSRNNSKNIAVMFVDLDQFKVVNDTLGHNIGDLILQQASKRLVHCVRKHDIVARYGGDEFVLLLQDIDEDECHVVIQRIFNEFCDPFIVDYHEIFISPSIGISFYPEDAEDAVSLLKNADTAMYAAKEKGKNSFQFYSSELNTKLLRKVELEIGLRKALSNNEFELFYQPQVDMGSGNIVGLEALIRWRHPVYGMVSPSEFIPLAEETGLINSIGEWVLETASAQNKLWQQAGFPCVPVSVNVSGRQFKDTDFPAIVKRVLDKNDLEHHFLNVEITESIMQEIGTITQIVKDLQDLSVKVSIDDFGTGYSSLNLLKNLSVDNIKIDPSFIWDMSINPNTEILIKYIIDMAHKLGFSITAEGIEHEDQLLMLERNKCDMYQGYYFSRPLPAGEIEVLWRKGA